MEIKHFISLKLLVLTLTILAICFVGKTLSTKLEFETILDKGIKLEFAYYEEWSLSMLHCAYFCSKNESCKSASFNDNDGSCRLSLYQVNMNSYQDRMMDEVHWTTVSKKVDLEDWTKIGDSHYIFTETKIIYDEARKYCEEIGGKLAEPRSNASFELLRTYMLDQFSLQNFWFGVSYIEEEGNYVWNSDGVKTSYSGWHSSKPNDAFGKCVYLYSLYGYLWSNTVCTAEWFTVCEY